MEVRRSQRPTAVVRGSRASLNNGASPHPWRARRSFLPASASWCIVRNFHRVKGTPPAPRRVCRKKTGPREVTLTTTAEQASTGRKRNNSTAAARRVHHRGPSTWDLPEPVDNTGTAEERPVKDNCDNGYTASGIQRRAVSPHPRRHGLTTRRSRRRGRGTALPPGHLTAANAADASSITPGRRSRPPRHPLAPLPSGHQLSFGRAVTPGNVPLQASAFDPLRGSRMRPSYTTALGSAPGRRLSSCGDRGRSDRSNKCGRIPDGKEAKVNSDALPWSMRSSRCQAR